MPTDSASTALGSARTVTTPARSRAAAALLRPLPMLGIWPVFMKPVLLLSARSSPGDSASFARMPPEAKPYLDSTG